MPQEQPVSSAPVYEAAPQYNATPVQHVHVDQVLQDFEAALPSERRLKISFAKNGIQLLGEVAQQHFPGRNIYPILQKTLMRIYAAVYVLIDVEWRANHISPYDKHSIHFESNRRFSREHPPPLWLQHFDIIVQATSAQHLGNVGVFNAMHWTAGIRVNNLTQRGPLPSFPLSKPRYEQVNMAVPSRSGVEADTAIDSDLRTWELKFKEPWDIRRSPPKHDHLVWLDRFTMAKRRDLPTLSPENHPVWWQWAASLGSQQGVEYANDFEKQHRMGSAAFVRWRIDPSATLLLIFRDPPTQPQTRRSSEAGSGAPVVHGQ